MPILVPIEEMVRNAGRYLLLAESGQTILITRGETAVAKLTGLRAEEAREDRLAMVKSLFGLLPKDASLGAAQEERSRV